MNHYQKNGNMKHKNKEKYLELQNKDQIIHIVLV